MSNRPLKPRKSSQASLSACWHEFWDRYFSEYPFTQDTYLEGEHGVTGLGTVTVNRVYDELGPNERTADVFVLDGATRIDSCMLPSGIKVLALIDCAISLLEGLPQSLVYVVVILSTDRPTAKLTIDLAELPHLDRLKVWDYDHLTEVTCSLAEGMESVSVQGTKVLTLKMPRRRGPKHVKLVSPRKLKPLTLTRSLRKLEVHSYMPALEGIKLPITLACSNRLQSLDVMTPVTVATTGTGSVTSLEGTQEVSTMAEYQLLCQKLRPKKLSRWGKTI